MKFVASIFRNNSLPEPCLYTGKKDIFSRSFSAEYLQYSVNGLQLSISVEKTTGNKDNFPNSVVSTCQRIEILQEIPSPTL
jgi:hypothetical protein